MKLLNQDYLGSGQYQINYQNFVKICVKSQKREKLQEFKIDAPSKPLELKNDSDLD